MIAAARNALPAVDDPGWIRYRNALEDKWAYESYPDMPCPWAELMDDLRDPELIATVSQLVGARLQAPDAVSRGGGLHLMFPGGYLGPHVDYALHPSGLERRANLVLFLDDCDPLLGGGLRLGDPARKTIYPRAGEAVVWECGDDTIHGVEPLHPLAPPRVTAAAYYLAEPRPGCTRRRALFLPPR